MIITKITFKNLSEEETRQLLDAMKNLGIPHDKEIMDLDDSWKKSETASKLFKGYMKAKGTFQEFILNNKF